MKNKITLIIFLFLAAGRIFSQTVYPVLNIGVTKSTFTFRQPWCGGMNAPQLTQGDLNGDGLNDLYAFDRSGDKSLVFLNNGSNSDTAFDYKPLQDLTFPDLQHHAQLRDYNHDSVPDIFTWTPTGHKLYKGIRNFNTVSYQLVNSLLLYQDNSNYTNMFSLTDDFSPFVDVNGDGDIDFLTFGLTSSVEYFENQTVELGLPYDSIRYAAPNTCWGHFIEDAAFSSIHLISCKTDKANLGAQAEEDASRHSGGSTIYAFDRHNDNDIDLIIGDYGWEKLAYLENCGTNVNAAMCTIDSVFPSCNISNNGIVFPTAFGVDADNDNLTDILVAPNPTAGTADIKNINYYRNTGDTSCPYQFVSDSFLVSQMLDFGTDSKPVVFDYNNDGLLDIVVGNYGYYRPFQTYQSELALLENTGTNTNPKFNLRDLNYSNLAQYNIVGAHPTFGDLNGDGYKDLLVGDLNGNLSYFKSPATSTVIFGTLNASQFMNIDVGQYCAPFILDINNDGLNDILCGRKDGKLTYLWNYGTPTNPLFSMDSANTYFGGINVTLSGSTEGYSQPFITTDSAGNKFLYVGSNRGIVFKFQIDHTKLRGGTFSTLNTDVLQFDVGAKSVIAIADMNNDGKTDYITGNSRGGLMYFSEALLDSSVLLSVVDLPSVNFNYQIYPNPASSTVTLQITDLSFEIKTIVFYDIWGRAHSVPFISAGNGTATLSTINLPSGLYIVILNNNFSKVKKLIVKN